MENDRLIEKINTALNILEGVRAEIIKADGKEKKKARKNSQVESDPQQQKEIKRVLEKYGQPTDEEHIASVQKIVSTNDITLEQLDACLERVKYANDKDPKNNIKAYTYSCLHKINKS